MSLRKSAAIVGLGELAPTRDAGGRTALELVAEVAQQALADAGLKPSAIDGLATGMAMSEFIFNWNAAIAEYLHLRPRFCETVDLGGATGAGLVWRAAAAIQAGLATNVLCVIADPNDLAAVQRLPAFSLFLEFERPYGPMGANSGYALVAQRHMAEYGTTPAQLAKIAVDQRTNALANPLALFNQQAITVEDVLNSPLICDPLHLLEIVKPCAGGAAVIVTGADRARDFPNQPVWLLGAGECVGHGDTIVYADSYTTSPIQEAAATAFRMAGVTPRDVRLASVYDCYTITVAITLEDAGFCAKGEGGPFVAATDLTYQGALPVNTHGGQLSFGQPGLAGGFSHVTEAVRQLRGQAGERQVADCQLAYVNGNGGILSDECSLILGAADV